MEIWNSGTSDLDLGRKVGNLDLGGVFRNFGFGLRKLEKLEIWTFGNLDWGGYSGNLDLDLGRKVGNLDLGGVFRKFGFALRKKSWKFGFLGWGGISGKVMEKKKKPTLQKN